MKKKIIIVIAIGILLLIILNLFIFVVAPLTGEVINANREETLHSQKLAEESREYWEEYGPKILSYDILIKEWDRSTLIDPLENPEMFNNITTAGNKIIIKQVFIKPTPCTSMNYTIQQEEKMNHMIHVIPKILPPEDPEVGCIAVMAYDDVEINIAVNEKAGSYGVHLHHYGDETNPFLSRKITNLTS